MHIYNSIIRSILGISAGLLMIMWPEQVVHYLIMLTGAFFIAAGIYTVILHLRDSKNRLIVYSAALACALLGIWLIIAPLYFKDILMYAWGILFTVAGVQQTVSLLTARRSGIGLSCGFYVLPAIITVAGIVILLHIGDAGSYVPVLSGIMSLLYGLNELICWYRFTPSRSQRAASNRKTEETEEEESTIITV